MEDRTQLILRLPQYPLPSGRQVLAAAVDVERQHRHRRAVGLDLRRRLCSADRFNDSAIARGLRLLNTPFCKVSASLSRVTRADQRLPDLRDILRRG